MGRWGDSRSEHEKALDQKYADARVKPGRPDEITEAVANAADRITAYRVVQQMAKEGRVPLEIKGLKAGALTMRSHIEKLQNAYAKFNETAQGHVGDVEAITKQVSDQQADLEFAVGVIKNSTEEIGEKKLEGGG